jgi:hypothetical protein
MFAVYCPRDRSRVLLDLSRVVALRNTPDGPVLDWECWCGARGQYHVRSARGVPVTTGSPTEP